MAETATGSDTPAEPVAKVDASAPEEAAPAPADADDSAKRSSTTADGEPSAKRAAREEGETTKADEMPSSDPDENGFVHPAAMAQMDPNSAEYKSAYSAFESNSALYYEKFSDYYAQSAAGADGGAGGEPGETEETVEVPDMHIGRIIGKGGATVRMIQSLSGTHIDIPNECQPGSTSRLVRVRGQPTAISYCRKIIDEKIKGENAVIPLPTPGQGDPSNPVTTKVILVPDDQVGRVIGRQGATVRQIQDMANCHVDVAKTAAPGATEREITITGPANAIANCENLIRQKLAGDNIGPAPGAAAAAMGGMPGAGGAGLAPNEVRVFIPGEMVGRVIGRGGATIRELQEHSGAHMDVAKEVVPGSTQRGIVLRGTPQQQQQCIQLTNMKIAEMTGDFNTCYVLNEQGMPAIEVQQGPPMGFGGFYGAPPGGQMGGFGNFAGFPQGGPPGGNFAGYGQPTAPAGFPDPSYAAYYQNYYPGAQGSGAPGGAPGGDAGQPGM